MIYWNSMPITNKEKEALIHLYHQRGLTNEQLRVLISGHLKSSVKGQKDNISRYTSSVSKKKLIRSASCLPHSRQLIFYLTQKGVDFVKEHITIDPSNKMAGFGEIYGDFDAQMLKPALKNIEHTMMFLEFAVKHPKNVRHNLYAVQEFDYISNDKGTYLLKKGKVKPDGEYLTKDLTLFSLEIDTGTERADRLISKFENYKRLFDELEKKNKRLPWEGILFVCKTSKYSLEKDPRIKTIFEAASAGLKNYCWTIPVKILNRTGENKTIDFKVLLNHHLGLVEKLNIPIPPRNSYIDNTQVIGVQRRDEQMKKDEVDFLTKRFENDRKNEAELKKQQEERNLIESQKAQINKRWSWN